MIFIFNIVFLIFFHIKEMMFENDITSPGGFEPPTLGSEVPRHNPG